MNYSVGEDWPSQKEVIDAQERAKLLYTRVIGTARLLSLVYGTVTKWSNQEDPWNLLGYYNMRTTARILGAWQFYDGMNLIEKYGTWGMEDKNHSINSTSNCALMMFGAMVTKAEKADIYDNLMLTKIPLMNKELEESGLEPAHLHQYRFVNKFRVDTKRGFLI